MNTVLRTVPVRTLLVLCRRVQRSASLEKGERPIAVSSYILQYGIHFFLLSGFSKLF
jgi:hypothetical protein